MLCETCVVFLTHLTANTRPPNKPMQIWRATELAAKLTSRGSSTYCIGGNLSGSALRSQEIDIIQINEDAARGKCDMHPK